VPDPVAVSAVVTVLVGTAEEPPDALTVSDKGKLALPIALVAVNVIDPDAITVGVPDSSPDELNVSPVGRVPLVTLHVIVGEPVAVNCVFV
jgi:hypothetical protein